MSSLSEKMEELSFIGRYGWRMDNILFDLVFSARSKRELRRLHDNVMPPDWRLLRGDLVNLEEFWELHFKPNISTSFSDLDVGPEDYLRWSIKVSRETRHSGLTQYYKEKIDKGRKKKTDFREEKKAKIVAITEKQAQVGSGRTEKIKIKLFDHDFTLELFYSSSHEEILARFYTWEAMLTEPLTFKLLSLPESFIGHRLAGGYQGQDVDFCYILNTKEWFKQYLASEDLILEYHRTYFVLIKADHLNQFLSELKQKMKEIGIPIEKIYTKSRE